MDLQDWTLTGRRLNSPVPSSPRLVGPPGTDCFARRCLSESMGTTKKHLRTGSSIGPGRAEAGEDFSRRGDRRLEHRGERPGIGDKRTGSNVGPGGSPGRGYGQGFGREDDRGDNARSPAGKRRMSRSAAKAPSMSQSTQRGKSASRGSGTSQDGEPRPPKHDGGQKRRARQRKNFGPVWCSVRNCGRCNRLPPSSRASVGQRETAWTAPSRNQPEGRTAQGELGFVQVKENGHRAAFRRVLSAESTRELAGRF